MASNMEAMEKHLEHCEKCGGFGEDKIYYNLQERLVFWKPPKWHPSKWFVK